MERLQTYMGEKVKPEDLKPGDHIMVWRYRMAYAHHGIVSSVQPYEWTIEKLLCVVSAFLFLFPALGQAKIMTLLSTTLAFWTAVSPYRYVKVIHYTYPRKTGGTRYVQETSLADFLLEGTLRRVRYGVGFWQRRTAAGTRHGKESDPPEVVLKRTYELLGGGHKQYNVLLNNCEHFAYYCKTGRPWSDQAGATLNLFGKLTGHNRLFSKNINSNSKL